MYLNKPHSGCAWFFTCENGEVIYEGRCGDSYWFNYDDQLCDYKGNVECEDPQVPRECPGASNITIIPHPDTCSKFTVCFENIFNDRECPFGLHFSYYDGRCVDPRYADCDIDKILCKESIENNGTPIFVENTRSCESYFLCLNKQSLVLRCAPGTQYDKENYWCDLKENVQCDTLNPENNTRIPDEEFHPICEGRVGQNVPHPYVSHYHI